MPAPPPVPLLKPVGAVEAKGTEAEQYCANIADAAADARFAWQAKTLQDLAKDVDGKVAALEAKRAEYEDWLHRREDFLKKAEDGVVAIYAKMRPETAAVQIAAMDEQTAAAMLAKLPPRAASAILNEMEPAVGAKLTNAMTGVATAAKDKSS